jgi:myo-inositol 2-dehydrogenase/D-chiro-inositol 1-dehydrogenase
VASLGRGRAKRPGRLSSVYSAAVKNVAVIGAGGMGREHIKNLSTVPGVQLVAVADFFTETASSAAEPYGVRATDDAAGLIGGGELDAVVIASSDETHADFAVTAIDAGLMVLCEKPLAHDLENAKRVVAAEVALGRRVLQVGFNRIYDEVHGQVAAALTDLGRLHHVRVVHRNANVHAPRTIDQVLTQSVIHDVHFVRWLAGSEIVDVSTFQVDRPGSVASVHLVAELASGAMATIDFDDTAFGYEVTVEASASEGMVITSPPQQATVRVGGDSIQHIGSDWFGRFSESYRREAHVWGASVVAGQAVGPTAWDGLAAQFAVDAAIRAGESGEAVAVGVPPRPELYAEGAVVA